ncbi:hypothetical protein CAJAP_07494 [Camponotus japonicus]
MEDMSHVMTKVYEFGIGIFQWR